MISINMQGRDWSKNVRDCRLAWTFNRYKIFALTAARVCIKGINILLTCTVMAGAVIGLLGFPYATFILFQVLRPISLVGLIGSISGEFIDYYANKRLLRRLEIVKNHPDKEKLIQSVVKNFLVYSFQPTFGKLDPEIVDKKEGEEYLYQKLALDMVRQLDDWPLDTLKQGLTAQSIGQHSVLNQDKSLEVFLDIELKLKQSKTFTKANICLIALGYVSMGICKLFPMTLVQYSVTLGMSILYTCRLIYMKFTLRISHENS